MELEVGGRRQASRRRRQNQAGRSGCRLPEAADDGSVGGVCLAGGDLLLDDRRHERGKQLPRPG
jgi:hypothetical protein